MEEQLVGSFSHRDFKAEVYSKEIPGEFRVAFLDGAGHQVEERPLTGISSYKQREDEIKQRLHDLADGAKPQVTPDRGDSGEY